MGYVPSVDICFTQEDDTVVRDSYIFKSLSASKSNDDIEKAKFSLRKEIDKLTIYNDYSKEAL